MYVALNRASGLHRTILGAIYDLANHAGGLQFFANQLNHDECS